MLSCSFRWFESCAALWRVAPALVSARAVVTVVWDSSHGAVESRKTISLASSGACVCFIIGVTISTAQQLLFSDFVTHMSKPATKYSENFVMTSILWTCWLALCAAVLLSAGLAVTFQ